MAKSWKDVKPGDPDWEIKHELDRRIRTMNITFTVIGVVFVLVFITNYIWHWSGK